MIVCRAFAAAAEIATGGTSARALFSQIDAFQNVFDAASRPESGFAFGAKSSRSECGIDE